MMKTLRVLGLGVFLTMPLCLMGTQAPEPVALVYSFTGEASLTAPNAARRPLRLLDRLSAGTTVEVGAGSRLSLAFVNGLRYELGERSEVALGPTGLSSQTGPVRALPRAPTLPSLAPIAAEDRPGARAGAVRIRAERITGLHPDRGVTSLASATRLRFDPVTAAPQYRVQIIDQEGKALFRIDTEATGISVPPGVLAPGRTYRWTVETRDRPGAVARGEATLVILDAGRAQAREELRRWVQRSGAADDLKLLEGVDRALGLWEEHQGVAEDARSPFSALRRPSSLRPALSKSSRPSGNPMIPSLVIGNELFARGHFAFANAESALLHARRILEEWQPESTTLASTLHKLGVIASYRGDYDAAESLFRRELALYERLDPDGSLVLDTLIGLGEVALQQNQADKAEEWWQRALAISPAGPKRAWCLWGLAGTARLQGRSAEAEELLQQALSIWQEINPEAVDAGSIHLKIGILFLDQSKTEAAEAHLRSAIRIHEKNGLLLPESHHALARLRARKGQAEEAAATYLAAIDLLELQRMLFGGAQESRWLFGSSLGDLYFEAAEHQITLGRPQEAWELVERGRARSLQELLAQRDLRFAGELPAELDAERRRLAAEYDRVQADLADWMPEQGLEKIEMLQGRLRDLRLEQAQVQKRIPRSSPRPGALASPAPLDLAAARSALDPGTVLLTYSVGESQSFLFVIEAEGASGPGLSFYPLPVGRKDLAKDIEAFRRLLGRPDTLLPALKQHGRHLYDLLVRPAEPVLAKAGRWLISPDGPLHSLPFAALVSGDRYLAESKPILIVASAAVYKEIKETRSEEPSAAQMELLAVGDPLYPAQRLPATRSEVKAMSDLFPGARVLLGRDATEEAIKTMAPQARRLHFACHGLLDEKFPLNSALALSIPEKPEEGRDNGLLQAWEIFEELRLEADLVTLSACDSGLGKEMGGEGLVGLARAFQFAGARSVLASLWSVSDLSTARFMKSFYGYLRNGKSKDEALRAAQADQIRDGAGDSHPFHWGAFQLFGDWR